VDYKRTETQKKKCWEELVYAVKKLFDKNRGGYSKEVKASFLMGSRRGGTENEMSIFIDDKNFRNRYFTVGLSGVYPDEKGKDYWCWEIFLHKNGTWTIK